MINFIIGWIVSCVILLGFMSMLAGMNVIYDLFAELAINQGEIASVAIAIWLAFGLVFWMVLM